MQNTIVLSAKTLPIGRDDIKTVTACSERKVEESDQMKKVYFQFVKYREYVR